MFSAVIFDMDGVLIDSEPFWQQAQIEVMAELGHQVNAQDCAATIGLRIDQLVASWFARKPWQGASQHDVVERIVSRVSALITAHGTAKCGVHTLLAHLHAKGLPIGLATSSPLAMVDAVLEKLGIGHYFTAVHSAQAERFGKPHPDVYIHAAQKLAKAPTECLAIEDSFNGLLAAKAACMPALIVPDPAQRGDARLAIADYQLDDLSQLTAAQLAAWQAAA
ncbi:MAG: hexitol phosphatase HxpB [Aeromonas sp.]